METNNTAIQSNWPVLSSVLSNSVVGNLSELTKHSGFKQNEPFSKQALTVLGILYTWLLKVREAVRWLKMCQLWTDYKQHKWIALSASIVCVHESAVEQGTDPSVVELHSCQ